MLNRAEKGAGEREDRDDCSDHHFSTDVEPTIMKHRKTGDAIYPYYCHGWRTLALRRILRKKYLLNGIDFLWYCEMIKFQKCIWILVTGGPSKQYGVVSLQGHDFFLFEGIQAGALPSS